MQRNLGSDYRSFPANASTVSTATSQPLSGFGTGLDLYNYTYSNWNKIWTSPTRTSNHLTGTGNNLNSLNNLTNNLNGGLHSTNTTNNPENSTQASLLSSNYLPANPLLPGTTPSGNNISGGLPDPASNGDSSSFAANGSSPNHGRQPDNSPPKKEVDEAKL